MIVADQLAAWSTRTSGLAVKEADMGKPAIEVRGLRKSFYKKKAVAGIDLEIVDKGKILATGTTDEVRGGKTLQQAFIDLVGPRAKDEGGLSWLGSSSN
jgi:ABC-type uncharacterized transport system ATPase subunit